VRGGAGLGARASAPPAPPAPRPPLVEGLEGVEVEIGGC